MADGSTIPFCWAKTSNNTPKRKAEAERKAQEEAKRKAEAERKALEEAVKREVEAELKAQEEAKRKAEAERKAQIEANRQTEERRYTQPKTEPWREEAWRETEDMWQKEETERKAKRTSSILILIYIAATILLACLTNWLNSLFAEKINEALNSWFFSNGEGSITRYVTDSTFLKIVISLFFSACLFFGCGTNGWGKRFTSCTVAAYSTVGLTLHFGLYSIACALIVFVLVALIWTVYDHFF